MSTAAGSRRHALAAVLLMSGLVVVVVLAALVFGAYPLAITDAIAALLAGPAAGGEAGTVIWNLRLPRIAAGLLVGMALSVAGAAYQGMFRNPLVSPDILGVSAGAGLGAAIAILLGLPLTAVQACAFGGGLLAV
ncbi:MAG TPA: iron chelate uptake ABC transporter family permease subunit, partial [Thauera sp.]|nr:iron chelate uptake ABC transporter family permease subunit [Thauera sp.]